MQGERHRCRVGRRAAAAARRVSLRVRRLSMRILRDDELLFLGLFVVSTRFEYTIRCRDSVVHALVGADCVTPRWASNVTRVPLSHLVVRFVFAVFVCA
jgi:hypothetical protein